MTSPNTTTSPFNISSDADFFLWARPMMVYILSRGEVIPPPRDAARRAIFRQVLERMNGMAFAELVAGLEGDGMFQAAFHKFLDSEDTRVIIHRVGTSWPATVSKALAAGGGWHVVDEVVMAWRRSRGWRGQ